MSKLQQVKDGEDGFTYEMIHENLAAKIKGCEKLLTRLSDSMSFYKTNGLSAPLVLLLNPFCSFIGSFLY